MPSSACKKKGSYATTITNTRCASAIHMHLPIPCTPPPTPQPYTPSLHDALPISSVPSCRTLHLTVLAKGFNKNQLAITNLNDRNTFFRIVTVVKCIISCNSLEVANIPHALSDTRSVGR